MNKKNYRYCLHINWHQSKKIISVSCVSCFRFAFRSQFSSKKGRPMNDKFMRSVIKLGKMKKFTVDTAMFIIRRGVIYFLGALRNLLSANQFRQCQYLPRFARAIIPWIMFFEAAAVLYAWKGTWKSVQKYRDQIEFSWFTLAYEIARNNIGQLFLIVDSMCFIRKHWSAFTRNFDLSTCKIWSFFLFQCFIHMLFNASRLLIW